MQEKYNDFKSRENEINIINEISKKYPLQESRKIREESFILAVNSLRFFPHWEPKNINQIVGLIEMINYINKIDSSPKQMIEIGTFLGESTSIFLGFENIKKIYCIDAFFGGSKIIENFCEKRLEPFINENRCFLIKQDSKQYLKKIKKNSIDLIYIDGDHTYDGVLLDIKNSMGILKSNGFICGHDFYYHNDDIKNAIIKILDENNINLNKVKVFRDGSWCIQL